MRAARWTKSLPGLPPSALLGWGLRYGFAIGAVVAATVLRYWLGRSFGLTAPYITFYPVVVLVAIVAGFGPGLIATLLSLAAAADLFLAPPGFAVHNRGDQLGMALFLVMAGAINLLTEVMRRRNAELKRKQSDLDRAQAVAEVGSWYLDIVRDVLTWSRETYRLFQVPTGTPLSLQAFLERVHPEDRQRVSEAWSAALQGAAYDIEHRILVDGHTRWVRERAKVRFSAEGKPRSATGTVQEITDRKRAEQELQRSKDDWERTFDAVPDAIMLLDWNHRILRANKALQPFVGLEPAAVIGKPCFEAIHNRTSPHAECPYVRMLQTGRGQQSEVVDPRVGKIFDVSVTPLWEGETFRAAVHVMRDITDRKLSEEQLRQQLRVNDAMFDQALTCFVLLDPQFNFLRVNEAYAKACHRKVEDFPGHNHFEFYPSDAKEIFDEVVRTGRPARVRARPFSFPDEPERGTTYWDWTLQPIFDEAGVLEFLFFSLNDVTEQELAQIQLKHSQDELARKHEQVRKTSLYARSLIEASPDPLVTISPEGKITDVNAATETVTGFSRQHLVGSDFSDYFTEPSEARQGYQQVFEKGAVHDYPLAIRHASGQLTHVLYNASLFKNENGQVEGVIAVARDISERKVLEEQLLQAQKLEAIGRLAGGVAHDFNNIMAIILGYAGLIQERLTPGDALAEPIENIRKAAERAAGVTRQLLAFSRKQVMKPKVLDLNDLVTEGSQLLERLIGENIELILKLSPERTSVRADPVQIDQVLMNLALNARDAMPEGGTLTIATARVLLDSGYQKMHAPVVPGPYVMVSVSDTGPGMDEQTRAHVFEPFFTTKAMGRGTGLGLSIVYGIVKQSGGNIWLYSEPGHGTTVKVYLPAIEVGREVEPERKPAPAPARGVGTLLLVEDEVALVQLGQTVLEAEGYSVLAARSAEEALDLARNHPGPISLLLTDVVLRGRMDGFELASQLCALRPETKVLFMSGYSDAMNSTHREGEQHAPLLEKPFTMEDLRAAVGALLTAPLSTQSGQ